VAFRLPAGGPPVSVRPGVGRPVLDAWSQAPGCPPYRAKTKGKVERDEFSGHERGRPPRSMRSCFSHVWIVWWLTPRMRAT
jgi:hypothetical protein